jgi:hypothetical protein
MVKEENLIDMITLYIISLNHNNPKLHFLFLHRYKTPWMKIIYKFQYFHENNPTVIKVKWYREITIN